MLVKGDKIMVINPIGMFTTAGDICNVTDVSESGVITFEYNNGQYMGCMSYDQFEKYFVKYEETSPTSVSEEQIEEIMKESKFIVTSVFDKCTIVSCKLPNGFVLVESSACIDPQNYNQKMGVEICMNRIKEKLFEMEAYRLQQELWEEGGYDDDDEDEDSDEYEYWGYEDCADDNIE